LGVHSIGIVADFIFQLRETGRNKNCYTGLSMSSALQLQASLSCVSCTDRIETV
jgi:hypothetical protein